MRRPRAADHAWRLHGYRLATGIAVAARIGGPPRAGNNQWTQAVGHGAGNEAGKVTATRIRAIDKIETPVRTASDRFVATTDEIRRRGVYHGHSLAATVGVAARIRGQPGAGDDLWTGAVGDITNYGKIDVRTVTRVHSGW